MQMTSTRAALVGISDLHPELAGVTATLSRSEVEEAAQWDDPELRLEVRRGDESAEVGVVWQRGDLEQLLRETSGDEITLMFDRDELEQALIGPDVEGHGLREKAMVLSVAAAFAAAGASAAAAAPDSSVGAGTPVAAAASHDEAGLSARGIEAAAGHDEAGLVARGIEAAIGTTHDEASLASRGITAGTHDEASLASRGIEAQPVRAAHDEASLASRGITAGTHDEASLASRGIAAQSLPGVHDEAGLVSRGIVEAPTSVHDEASLAARGIDPVPVSGDGGTGFEMPTVDATTAAVGVGVAGGIALLITAAGFAARRDRGARPV